MGVFLLFCFLKACISLKIASSLILNCIAANCKDIKLTKINRRIIILFTKQMLVNKPFSRFLHTHQIDCPRRTKQCQEKEYLNLLFILL